MGITETLVFYLLVGIAVAVAMYVSNGRDEPTRVAFLLVTSVLFWPLYVPVLLSAHTEKLASPELPPQAAEMAAAIAQVERELAAALSSLDGWPETALAREQSRIAELSAALGSQATRIREMDDLLAQVGGGKTASEHSRLNKNADAVAVDRWEKSSRAREQNFARLAIVRRHSHADLMATLAWIRELVSMIHLAKFAGAPVSRTEELVAQIAAAVEAVSVVKTDVMDDVAV